MDIRFDDYNYLQDMTMHLPEPQPQMGFAAATCHDNFFDLNEWIDIHKYSSISIHTHHSSPGNAEAAAMTNREDNKLADAGKVVFKTKSQIEILDDGFKWIKYGKKMVKNSPNPRNYYRCSNEGCPVKKRVERDNQDPLYVLTTYQGIHNHLPPP